MSAVVERSTRTKTVPRKSLIDMVNTLNIICLFITIYYFQNIFHSKIFNYKEVFNIIFTDSNEQFTLIGTPTRQYIYIFERSGLVGSCVYPKA